MSKNPNKVVALSGGFDPLHIGHIQFFKDASEYGKVVVILNSDEWIIRKKGFCFMPWTERHRMITSIPWVSDVVKVDDRYGNVTSAISKLKPDYFGNGGSRKRTNTSKAEIALCEKEGITMLWNLGENSFQDANIAIIQSRLMKEMIKLIQKYEEIKNWEK
tara:strand:+ start:29 stop:511 length:483 start_codon:yes stop_codon:yes gene_type:complete